MMLMLKSFEAARRVSVPIVGIRTIDQTAAIDEIRTTMGTAQQPQKFLLFTWDAVRGIQPANDDPARKQEKGAEALAREKIKSDETVGFVEAMIAAQLLPAGSVLCVRNAHRQLQSQEPAATAAAVQAVANLRDTFKKNYRMLVPLGPYMPLPLELEQDVVVLSHALPDHDSLKTIVEELHVSAQLAAPLAELVEKAVDATSGLSAFAAEQVVAMSLTENGLDLDALWERKRVAIEQTRGLSVWRGGERFSDLVGLDNIKTHLTRRLSSRTPVGCVLFVDEIDKALANVEHDTSGVRMDQLRVLLTEMENHEWRGAILVGVAGGGKSAIAKAFGNEAGVPTAALDLGGMESKYVGESEANIRQAMEIVKAIGRGNVYVIATSNNASVMRPELQRRFTDGMWMFDLMSEAERTAAWTHYIKKYDLKAIGRTYPADAGWTGAEIRNCCRYAWDTGCSLTEAARFIVPMAQSRADAIEDLRRYAHGRFLDATRPGVYQYDAAPMVAQKRAITLADVDLPVDPGKLN